MRVLAESLDDPRLWVRAADVAADGTYRLADVFPGSYTVRVEATGSDPAIATRWYRDSATADSAVPVVVVDGADTTCIDIAAVAASRVTGVVTGAAGPLPGVEVVLEAVRGDTRFGTTWTNAQGAFSFAGLPAGEYRVRFVVDTGSSVRTLYFRAPSGTVPQVRAASTLRVGTGATVEIRARVRG